MRLILDASPDDYRQWLERERAEGYHTWTYQYGQDPLTRFVADALEHSSAVLRLDAAGKLIADGETSETYVFCFLQRFVLPDWMTPLWRYYHEEDEDFDIYTPISLDQALHDLEECLTGRAGTDHQAHML